MKRVCIGLIAVMLAPTALFADGRERDDYDGAQAGCGGDAYTFAEVVSTPRGVRQRGPIVTVPDTLCADLGNHQATRINSLNIYVGPDRNGGSAADQTGGLRPPSAYRRPR